MALDERARHHLYLRLEEHLGAEAAGTLMEHLPPTGWADVATKRDLDHLRTLMTSDIDQLRTLMTSDIDQLRTHVTSDLDQLRMHVERTGDQLRAEFYKAMVDQTRTVVSANIGTAVAVAGLAFAAARLT